MAETLVLTTIRGGLQADSTLMTLINGVYEVAPDAAVAPYITLNRLRLSDESTKTSALFGISVDLTIWDQSSSSKTVRSILERLRDLVPGLQPSTGQFIGFTIRNTDLVRDRAMNWIRTAATIEGHYAP